MQCLLWSTNEWWLNDKFDLYSSWNCICWYLRMDCKQTKKDEHSQCRAQQALLATGKWWQKQCWLLLLCPPVPQHPSLATAHHTSCKHGKKWTQPQSYGEHLAYHPLPLNKTGSREERMLSGDGQCRLGIYHFMFLHCNSGYTCRGQFLRSTKQMTLGNYIRTSI